MQWNNKPLIQSFGLYHVQTFYSLPHLSLPLLGLETYQATHKITTRIITKTLNKVYLLTYIQ